MKCEAMINGLCVSDGLPQLDVISKPLPGPYLNRFYYIRVVPLALEFHIQYQPALAPVDVVCVCTHHPNKQNKNTNFLLLFTYC